MNRVLTMMTLMRSIPLALLLFVGCAPKVDEFVSPDITSQELRRHIKYLASDELKGRKSGEEGNRLAADYIASQFKRDGLLSPSVQATQRGGYLQEFSFVTSRKLGERNNFRITVNGKRVDYKLGEQFRTLSFSADTSITAPLVFVGYGVSAHDSVRYDDYAGIDVHGKIVVVLRYSPDGPGGTRFSKHTGLMEKAITARDSGAAGIIFLTAPPGTEGSELSSFSQTYPLPTFSLPTVAVGWKETELLFGEQGKDLIAIKQHIDSTDAPSSFDLVGTTVSLATQVIKIYGQTANIVGYIPGRDVALNNEVVVIGAHMDHLGMGGEGSGSLKPDTIAIHHGADDNASGTAGLLEVAQYFAAHRLELKRTLVFIAFSGEELGLLGSAHYVKNPIFPLDKTVAMVNMDMVGRMKDSILVVEGMGTSPTWEVLVRRENRDSLLLKLKPDGFGPSDHSSFYAKNIPVMFFFTNLHSDYHRPSDTWEKINYSGEQKVVQLVARVVQGIANAPSRPEFTKAVASSSMTGTGDRQALRVTLGVIPDYAEDVQGLKISGTRAGSAAEKAGLKAEDVIIKFSGKDVKNIYDFMHLLEGHKPGDAVLLVVKRGTEEVSLTAVLEARK